MKKLKKRILHKLRLFFTYKNDFKEKWEVFIERDRAEYTIISNAIIWDNNTKKFYLKSKNQEIIFTVTDRNLYTKLMDICEKKAGK